jgi:hypothetical protein
MGSRIVCIQRKHLLMPQIIFVHIKTFWALEKIRICLNFLPTLDYLNAVQVFKKLIHFSNTLLNSEKIT